MGDFRMPALGADMEAGTLAQWLRQPGDEVRRGDIIAVVDTQKGAIEVEVFEEGTIEAILVQPGDTVPVGTVLATIRTAASSTVPGPRTGEEPPAAGATSDRFAETTAAPAASPSATERPRASPVARKLAERLSVDLARVRGTGPAGAITREDVERAVAAGVAAIEPAPSALAPAVPARTTPVAQPGMRAAIAAAMAKSKREIPHYYLSTTVDMDAAVAWLRAGNQRRSVAERVLMIALLVKSVARALEQTPELNGYWIDNAFRPGSGIHIGCAISLRGGGLVAPAVHDANRLDIGSLMNALRDLVARARAGSLRSSELSDATITVTNLGEQGVEAAFGIINPPQVALVGFGRIVDRPWIVDGSVRVRPVMTASLSADHRASDGHRGGMFLTALERALLHPEGL